MNADQVQRINRASLDFINAVTAASGSPCVSMSEAYGWYKTNLNDIVDVMLDHRQAIAAVPCDELGLPVSASIGGESFDELEP